MRQKLITSAVVSGAIAIALLVASVATEVPPTGPLANDEFGKPLESLFVGMDPDPIAKDAILENGALARDSSVPCRQTSEIASHLASWISPPSVAAYGCPGGGCSGHYQYSQSRLCPSGCNTSGRYNFFYSNPQRSPWQQGKRYAGNYACNNCGPCAERGCTNW